MPKLAKIALWFAALLASLAILALIGFFGLRAYYEPRLPSVESLTHLPPQAPLRVFSSDGKVIGEFATERRIPLTINQIPPLLIKAFLAAEDDRFYEHPGVDVLGLLRASIVLATTGEKRQGGSTITMQLARGVFLSRERTFDRKFKEIFLALKIEHELGKEQILTLYLNRIFLGTRAYGVGAAAQVYFGKAVGDLTLGEMAVLAALPKAPSRDNPVTNPERAADRRAYVLHRMRELGDIDDQQLRVAEAEPVESQEHPPKLDFDGGYVAEMVREQMLSQYGEAAYEEGLDVVTTIDSGRQQAAEKALRDGLYAYTERHGYDGAEGHIPPAAEADLGNPVDSGTLKDVLKAQPAVADLVPAIVLAASAESLRVMTLPNGVLDLPKTAFGWAMTGSHKTLRPGDLIHLRQVDGHWRLAQIPKIQGALVAVDPIDGAIQSLVGGFDFSTARYNRATQARRQVGSGFKPYLYTSALADGYTPASVFLDAPVVLANADFEDVWRPDNYSHSFNGPMRLREALVQSRNLVSVRLLQALGIDYALKFIPPRFGIPADRLPHDLTLALGSAALTPMEMARGYSVFANGGFLIDPYLIRSITRDGKEIFRAAPHRACPDCADAPPVDLTDTAAPPAAGEPAPRVISADVDWLITSMMHDVVVRGTGAEVAKLGRSDLAGKTGTTNDYTDAWFNGFNPTLVTICWVGADQPVPLGHGEVGGKAALPIWMDYMRFALRKVPQAMLPRPAGLVDIRINPVDGKLAQPGTPGAISEVVQKDHVPPPDDGRVEGNPGANLTDVLY